MKQEKEDAAFIINGSWEQHARQLKTKFPQLTSEDLKFEAGKESELLDKLSARLHKERGHIINLINGAHAAKG